MKREIKITEDGSSTLYLPALDEVYHSHRGAVQEALHVFIKNGIESTNKKHLNILEMGLGTGLNAVLTFEYAKKNDIHVHYEGIEAYPLEKELITALNYQEFFTESGFKAFENLHQAAWDLPIQLSTNFEITKQHQKIEDYTSSSNFDLIYFDAFGPRAQEEVWSSEIIEKMYLLLKKDGFLVTYCAKGEIKRRMKNAGFKIEALPGPPGKREMTRAWKR